MDEAGSVGAGDRQQRGLFEQRYGIDVHARRLDPELERARDRLVADEADHPQRDVGDRKREHGFAGRQ